MTPIAAPLRAACLAAALGLVATLFVGGAQPEAAGLLAPPWDKLAHLALFAVIAALLTVATGGRWGVAVVALLAIVGVGDELLQFGLPGRHPDLVDLATDFAGAALGVALTTAALRRAAAEERRLR